MRHHMKHGMKLGCDASHTKAMKRSLTCALFENDRIKTTLAKAKAIRRDVDKVITWAKGGTVAARRNAIALIGNKELVRETFEKASQGMWQGRPGGYTRIMKLGKRKGDNAEIVIMELVQEAVHPQSETPQKLEKKQEKKPEGKQDKKDTKGDHEAASHDHEAKTGDSAKDEH